MKTSRREILQCGVGAGLLWSARGGRQDAAQARTEAIARRRIPSSGELLPMIGLGTSRTFNVSVEQPGEALVAVMRGFFATGGSLIDSSPMYGRAEAVVGALLERVQRRDAFLATKVWTREGREAGMGQMRDSMHKMGTERMDLIQVHNLVDWEVQLATLRQWKAQGKIRYLGITEMRRFDLVVRLIEKEKLDFIQIPYSLGTRVVEERVLPAALEHGTAVLVMRPFERGGLFRAVRGKELPAWAKEFDCTSWAQFFLKFLLGHPAVTCPIPATTKVSHLLDNMRAGVGRLPDAKQRRRMLEVL